MKVIFDATPLDLIPPPLFRLLHDAVSAAAANCGIHVELVTADSVREAMVRWNELVIAKDAAEADARSKG